MRFSLRFAVLLPLVALLVSCSNGQSRTAASGEKMIPPEAMLGAINAPEFPEGLEWLNTSRPLTLREFRGKFVLLDFWTFCCINCMHILPDLKRLEQKYQQELVVIGVHSAKFANEKDTGQIRSAILRYKIEHPVVNDADFRIWNAYAARAWPTLALINPAGKIIARRSGEGVFEPFDALLRTAIPFFEARGQLRRSPLELDLEERRLPNTLLQFPGKVSADEAALRLFISDSNHNRILVSDPHGRILDVIGSGEAGQNDGSFEQASFSSPQGTYAQGDVLYIADADNHLIRVADLRRRRVETVLGSGEQARTFNQPGRGRSVPLNSPWDVLALAGELYIAMAGSHQLWVADLETWAAEPWAGSGREDIVDGLRLQAALAQPSGLATDGRRIYFADSETSSIRSADLDQPGWVRTLVGRGLFEFGDIDGASSRARLQHPLGLAWHDGLLYVADTYNSKIKVIDPVRGAVKTWAGSGRKALVDGAFSQAAFNEPGGAAWLAGKLYVADTNNHQIRVLDPAAKSVATLAFTGLEVLGRREISQFRGRRVELGHRQVRSGSVEFLIDVTLPPGYKFNTDAPFYLRWRIQSESKAKAPVTEEKSLRLPARFMADVPAGRSEVVFETVVYYCTERSSACYADPIRATVTLEAAPIGPAGVQLLVAARKPGS